MYQEQISYFDLSAYQPPGMVNSLGLDVGLSPQIEEGVVPDSSTNCFSINLDMGPLSTGLDEV